MKLLVNNALCALLAVALGFSTQATGQTKEAAVQEIRTPSIVIRMNLPAPTDSRGAMVAADVNGDGAMDLLVSTPGHLAAYALDGRELWHIETDIRLASKSERNGLPGHHGPGVQAGDIDGDGAVEVVYLTDDSVLHVLEGASGREKWTAEPPVPADADRWEQPIIANLRGLGDRDILLQATDTGQNRTWTSPRGELKRGYRLGRHLAAYAAEDLAAGKLAPLWQRDDYFGCAHNMARVADLDGDGRDEILGGTILSPAGELLATVPLEGLVRRPHLDSIFVDDVIPDRPGLEVVALEEGGKNRVFCYDQDGLIWQAHYEHTEPQNAALVRAQDPNEGMQVWCRSRYDEHQRPFVFDSRGRLLHEYAMDDVACEGWTVSGVEVINSIHWDGAGRQLAAAKERHTAGDVCIFEPISGEFLLRIHDQADRLYVADVTGDWREEIIVQAGTELHIYENTAANPNPDRPRLWTQNHYRRSKMTWNYYSP